MGAMALLPICDSSFTCEDYNAFRAHPWSPFPLRRAHPGPGRWRIFVETPWIYSRHHDRHVPRLVLCVGLMLCLRLTLCVCVAQVNRLIHTQTSRTSRLMGLMLWGWCCAWGSCCVCVCGAGEQADPHADPALWESERVCVNTQILPYATGTAQRKNAR